MEFGEEIAIRAWRRLAGAPLEGRLQVIVDRASLLAPPGWIGVVAIGDVVTASVPSEEMRAPVEEALADLRWPQASDADIVVPRLPATAATLGPAQLFYPSASYAPPDEPGDQADAAELGQLLCEASPDDLDESGIAHIENPAFVSRSAEGTIVAACGYRRWPNGVAHLSVLTRPSHRRQGHGRRAAAAAVKNTVAEGLLPQWRARPLSSQRLALALGFVQMGAQLSLQPA